MTIKRILAWCLCLALVLSCAPAAAAVEPVNTQFPAFAHTDNFLRELFHGFLDWIPGQSVFTSLEGNKIPAIIGKPFRDSWIIDGDPRATGLAYADKLYTDNAEKRPITGYFTWHGEEGKSNWIYYTGLVYEGLLALDPQKYAGPIIKYYNAYIREDGSIQHYSSGTLDAALPAANILLLLATDMLTEEERARYEMAANFVYNQLESQVSYPQAGGLLMHAQDSNGQPRAGWDTWTICLDGVYMSQLYMIRLAQAIQDGVVTVTDKDGRIVTAEEIWESVYRRLCFVMENMADPETGLLYHGYCVAEARTNGIFWSRGIGWYAMVLMEAADLMPDSEKQAVLKSYFAQLMDAIIAHQDSETGIWYNITNRREDVALVRGNKEILNIPESSGSAMFAYCLLRGYHQGLLEGEQYHRSGLTAFNSLTELKLTEDGLQDICLKSAVHESARMYQHFGYSVNDGKGSGPYILAAKYAY